MKPKTEKQDPLDLAIKTMHITEDREIGQVQIRYCFNEQTKCLEITSDAFENCWIALGAWAGNNSGNLISTASVSRASDDTCWVLIAYYIEP
jgi:hypothetical protein